MTLATAYEVTLCTLRNMDEKQLLELFHDIGELAVIERIADCAYYFVENEGAIQHHPNKEWVDNNKFASIDTLNGMMNEELKQADDARRHREHTENERRNY